MIGANNKCKAILLDCDGTLCLNAETIHQRATELAFREIYDRVGLHFNFSKFDDIWKQELGGGMENLYKVYLAENPDLRAAVGEATDEQIREFEELEKKHYMSMGKDLDPRPGLLEYIRAMKAMGVRVAIVSNATADLVDFTRKACGYTDDDVDLIIGIDTVRNNDLSPKDSGEPYLLACHMLGVRPSECQGFEDTIAGLRSLTDAMIGHITYCMNDTSAGFNLSAADDDDLREPDMILTKSSKTLIQIAEAVQNYVVRFSSPIIDCTCPAGHEPKGGAVPTIH